MHADWTILKNIRKRPAKDEKTLTPMPKQLGAAQSLIRKSGQNKSKRQK